VSRFLDVNVPSGLAVETFIRRVAPPQALYQHRSRGYLSVEMLLPLFLLYFQRESGTQYALYNCM